MLVFTEKKLFVQTLDAVCSYTSLIFINLKQITLLSLIFMGLISVYKILYYGFINIYPTLDYADFIKVSTLMLNILYSVKNIQLHSLDPSLKLFP